MPRALKDILTELNSVYNPQRDVYSNQLTTIDPQLQAETQGLEAQKRDAFDQITQGANRRGLFYSGLPIAEEQRYTGQQFLPAIANLRAKYAGQRFGLQDAIAKLTSEQYEKAYGIREKEAALEEEQRQFNERLAAQERASRASAGGGGGGGSSLRFGGGGASPAAQNLTREEQRVLQQEQLRAQAQKELAQYGISRLGQFNRAGRGGDEQSKMLARMILEEYRKREPRGSNSPKPLFIEDNMKFGRGPGLGGGGGSSF